MSNEITTLDTTKREQCPFYGFHYFDGIFMDQRGNQCALITESYSPCRMELNKQKVSWENCPLNTQEDTPIIEELLDNSKVFPDELHPKEASS